jgi:hypothetical protein
MTKRNIAHKIQFQHINPEDNWGGGGPFQSNTCLFCRQFASVRLKKTQLMVLNKNEHPCERLRGDYNCTRDARQTRTKMTSVLPCVLRRKVKCVTTLCNRWDGAFVIFLKASPSARSAHSLTTRKSGQLAIITLREVAEQIEVSKPAANSIAFLMRTAVARNASSAGPHRRKIMLNES